MSNSSSEREPIDQVAEEFLERFRRGERPSVADYADRHPELADEIRELFPALVVMEQAAPGSADRSGSLPKPANGRRAAPDRLGDFRILREVGRGGMGVVYEAIQESLGRHVALKLLPPQAILDPARLRRFQREAKAAANLHHTNIVPVYGVGEYEGTHYYAMQFIRGQGLETVIEELRRLREDAAPAGGAPRSAQAVAAARSLMTGEFIGGRSDLADGPAEPASPYGAATCTHTPGADSNSGANFASASGQSAGVATSSGITGTLTDTGRHYWESVARLGAQVADALAYAHAQGIIHRDVKPSNLLLDPVGTVWVTDFGLAKVMTDTDDLSHTGDILGTLRYMAPERFDGAGDARADVYALGLTLYELLTFRPAFDAENRHTLVEMVMRSEAPRPRKLNAAVPRDLETIILKATAKEPAQRYQTAAALATDLRRFVEDRPILARRASPGERAWRWCRRNPLVASLLGAVAALLVAVTAVSLVAAARDRAAFEEKQAAFLEKADALVAEQQAVKDREAALVAERQAVRDKDAALQAQEAAVQEKGAALLAKEAALAAAQKGKKLALKAVDDMWVAMADKWLEDAPELEPVQREFLQKAMALYQELAKDDDRDPEVRLAIGLAHRKIGEIRYRFDETEEAENAHIASVAALTSLLAEHPDDVRYQFELAVSCCYQAWRTDRLPAGRPAAAQVAQRAVDLLQKITARFPDDIRYQEWLATAYHRLGQNRSSPAEAEVDLRKAVELSEPLARAHPDNSSVRRRYYTSLDNLGHSLHNQGRSTEGVELMRQSLAGDEQLMKDLPREHIHRINYVIGLENLARSLLASERMAEVEVVTRQVIGHAERLVADYPSAPRYRKMLATSLLNLGVSQFYLDRPDEAEALYIRAIAQYEQLAGQLKDKNDYRPSLALALSNLGSARLLRKNYAEAAEAFRRCVATRQQLVAESPSEDTHRGPLASSYNQLVACWDRADRPDDALTALREFSQFGDEQVRKHPEVPLVGHYAVFARRRLGIEFSILGRHDEAEQTYLQALELAEQLMAKHPQEKNRTWDWPRTQFDRGINFLRKGEPQKALEVCRTEIAQYDRWLAVDPKRAAVRNDLQNAYGNVAVVFERLKRPGDAVEPARQRLTAAGQLASDFPKNYSYRTRQFQALAILTRLLHQAGATDEAVALTRRELTLPERPLAGQTDENWRNLRGNLLIDLGLRLGGLDRRADAEEAFQQALVVNRQLVNDYPKSPGHTRNLGIVHGNRANLFARTGQLEEAETAYEESLAHFEKLVELFPDIPADRGRLSGQYVAVGRYYLAQGQGAEAERYVLKAQTLYTTMLDNHPTSQLHMNNLAWFLCTCPIPSFRDPQRAVTLAEKAVNLDDRPVNLTTLGVAHYRAGNWQTAVAVLQQSIHQNNGLGTATDFYFLAMAKWQLGDHGAARKHLEEALWLTDTFSPDDFAQLAFRAEAERLIGIGKDGGR